MGNVIGAQVESVIASYANNNSVLETAKERAEFDKYYAQQEKEIPTNTLADLLGDSLTDKLK